MVKSGLKNARRLREERLGDIGYLDRLQQQMIETEGGVEHRIAEPGAFGIGDHRMPVAAMDQDILRAEVAVNERDLRRRSDADPLRDRVGKLGIAPGDRSQIGVETER